MGIDVLRFQSSAYPVKTYSSQAILMDLSMQTMAALINGYRHYFVMAVNQYFFIISKSIFIKQAFKAVFVFFLFKMIF